MTQSRRDFMASALVAGLAVTPYATAQVDSRPHITAREYLKKLLYTRKEVEDWLAEHDFPFAKYDAELGWLLRDDRVADGVDGSISTYTYGRYDERLMINHAGKPCRINTYGDSYTQCHQVSNGETWQEVLAAHIGEPVRNFGVGGQSVYQAYLRMLREEKRVPAETIIFNIYHDDHYRNLDAWRNIRQRKHPRFIEPTLPHVVVDLEKKTCAGRPNPCPTPESVYNLCELEWVVERFKDDFVLQIMLAHANARQGNPEAGYRDLQALATTHGIVTRIDEGETLSSAASEVHTRAALFSTMRIVEWIEEFAREANKQVLYVLSYSAGPVARMIREGTRFDQSFVEFMDERKLPYVDLMKAHVDDYEDHKLSLNDYLRQYYIGHYNPSGNFFCAFALKDRLVEMLEPKPPAYRK